MRNFLLFLTLLSMLFLFSGCISREISLSPSESKQSKNNGWNEQVNSQEEENVDTSDLEDELSSPEQETVIEEDVQTKKMERIQFPVDEYNRLYHQGKGTVKGAIFVKDAYGKRVLGAGTRLYLNPVTSYSNQWYEESYIGGYKMEKADARLFNYLRFTAADSSGYFSFYGVPSGRYYLIGTVKCGTECGYSSPKSIRIATQVSVIGNQVIRRDLSRMID